MKKQPQRRPQILVDGDPVTGLLQVVDRSGNVHYIKNRVCWCGHRHPDEMAIDVRTDDEIEAGVPQPNAGERP